MAIKMVREPSETPNINNIDDIVPMRYAYGNQNGFVIGKGNEISNTVNGLNFTVNSGRLVLQGVECDIDAVGVTITIDNIATTRYYVVYLQVNLGLNTAQILSSYDTATYPTIDAGDDLTENTTGVARLPLYQFTATNGVISKVNKVVESIKYTSSMSVANANTIQNVDLSSPNRAIFGNYTIQRRQVLWSGVHNISDNNIITLTNGRIAKGDILEVIWKGPDIVSATGQRVDRFKVIDFSPTIPECVLMEMKFFNRDIAYLGSARLFTISSTTINFGSFTYFAIEGLSSKGSTVQTRLTTSETLNFYVYEIAKII